MNRLIAHVDLDAFFASCEQRDNPEFRGRPVVVGALPGGRGVVAAASYEARRYGIRSAMPVSEAYRRCPTAVFVRPNLRHYAAVSRSVFASLESITPALEQASIDEAYLDLTGLDKLLGSPTVIGQRIKAQIFAAAGLAASVGIGPNRLIAKLGSDFRKPDGLTVVPADAVEQFMDPLPVSVLRGNGPVTQRIFRRLNITTCAELRRYDTAALAAHLGQRAALGFQRQARGISSAEVATGRRRKSISKERTFASDVADSTVLREQLAELARGVAALARREDLAGRVVKLKLRYHDFATLTRQTTLPQPSHDERVLRAAALRLLEDTAVPTKPIRLLGVGLSHWESGGATAQPDLFSATDSAAARAPRLLETIDTVNARYGDGKLRLGMQRRNKAR
ncbi:MAG: DNA polymerase IV [Gammaproteobacteria bacterium]|jgi:DNA polymerase-4|nr:DNA polymerase IV [Gammaproteobacteria bacterium]